MGDASSSGDNSTGQSGSVEFQDENGNQAIRYPDGSTTHFDPTTQTWSDLSPPAPEKVLIAASRMTLGQEAIFDSANLGYSLAGAPLDVARRAYDGYADATNGALNKGLYYPGQSAGASINSLSRPNTVLLFNGGPNGRIINWTPPVSRAQWNTNGSDFIGADPLGTAAHIKFLTQISNQNGIALAEAYGATVALGATAVLGVAGFAELGEVDAILATRRAYVATRMITMAPEIAEPATMDSLPTIEKLELVEQEPVIPARPLQTSGEVTPPPPYPPPPHY